MRVRRGNVLVKTPEFWRELLNSFPGWIFVANSKGQFICWSAAYQDEAGYSQSDMEQATLMDHVLSSDHQRLTAVFQEALSGETQHAVRFTGVTKSGDHVPCVATVRRVVFDEYPYVLGNVVRDKEPEVDIFGAGRDTINLFDHNG
ncbi:MAG: PAS domain S-box protein [Gammaproteobacteria bacterium]